MFGPIDGDMFFVNVQCLDNCADVYTNLKAIAILELHTRLIGNHLPQVIR